MKQQLVIIASVDIFLSNRLQTSANIFSMCCWALAKRTQTCDMTNLNILTVLVGLVLASYVGTVHSSACAS